MFHEFALDPAVLSSWDRARYFLDAFGPWKGRFLAEYPKRWKKIVIDRLTCQTMEKHRIVERLVQLDKRVFSPRTGAAYDISRSWLENAEGEHRRQPFRAIVAAEGSAKPYVLDGAEVDDRSPLWRVEAGRMLTRDPGAFSQALRLLLDVSTHIVVIDPYFRADQDDKTQPLVAFCRLLKGTASVEVHVSDEKRSYDLAMRDANRALPNILPEGMEVTLHCWSPVPGGARLHNRYLLTEIGGVQFGDSVEMGNTGQQDRVSILDESSRAALWEQYCGEHPAFKSAGMPQVFTGAPDRRR